MRSLLRPGEMVRDAAGTAASPSALLLRSSLATRRRRRSSLTPHFASTSSSSSTSRRRSRLQDYPRYVPCAVRILAFYLERFREAFGASLHIAVNGGYRSPAHKLYAPASLAHVGNRRPTSTAIGTSILNDQESDRAATGKRPRRSADELNVLPYGHDVGKADDHLHFDLGYHDLRSARDQRGPDGDAAGEVPGSPARSAGRQAAIGGARRSSEAAPPHPSRPAGLDRRFPRKIRPAVCYRHEERLR